MKSYRVREIRSTPVAGILDRSLTSSRSEKTAGLGNSGAEGDEPRSYFAIFESEPFQFALRFDAMTRTPAQSEQFYTDTQKRLAQGPNVGRPRPLPPPWSARGGPRPTTIGRGLYSSRARSALIDDVAGNIFPHSSGLTDASPFASGSGRLAAT
jgi:hypothetical protein